MFFILCYGEVLLRNRWDLRCLSDYARKDHRDPLHTYPLKGIRASLARGLRVLRFEWFFLFCFARQGYDLVPTYSQRDVEKVRAIVVPTYTSGSKGKETNVISMFDVSNLYHHIHLFDFCLKIFSL